MAPPVYVILSNGGNESVALIQWAIETKLPSTYVVVVDTGWSAPSWEPRIASLLTWVQQQGLIPVRLTPKRQFQELILDRGSFPSQKFQWCAGLLKGLPILNWLDEIDPDYQATIVIGHRRDSSRANFHLPERLEVSERYGDRSVWHPLVEETREHIQQRIAKTPLPWLQTRALECDPCIHCSARDLKTVASHNVQQTTAVETQLGLPMFEQDIYQTAKTLSQFQQQQNTLDASAEIKEHDLSLMDMGCGSPYGCGT